MLFHNQAKLNRSIPASQLEQVRQWVFPADFDFTPLWKASESGDLARWIPFWERLTGPHNTQHQTHEFPLDVHTLKVVEGTASSPYFQKLSLQEQEWVLWAALLHDIGKSTGPLELKPQLPVDFSHPFKSHVVAREILPQVGFSPTATERICRLIRFHQLFGGMMIRFPDLEQTPPPDVLVHAAYALRSDSMLAMLLALTEGDIRGVKAEGKLYDARVQEKLLQYSGLVAKLLVHCQDRLGGVGMETALDTALPENLLAIPWGVLKTYLAEYPHNALYRAWRGPIPMFPAYVVKRDLLDQLEGFGPWVWIDALPENVMALEPIDLAHSVGLESPQVILHSEVYEADGILSRAHDEMAVYLQQIAVSAGVSRWKEVFDGLVFERNGIEKLKTHLWSEAQGKRAWVVEPIIRGILTEGEGQAVEDAQEMSDLNRWQCEMGVPILTL